MRGDDRRNERCERTDRRRGGGNGWAVETGRTSRACRRAASAASRASHAAATASCATSAGGVYAASCLDASVSVIRAKSDKSVPFLSALRTGNGEPRRQRVSARRLERPSLRALNVPNGLLALVLREGNAELDDLVAVVGVDRVVVELLGGGGHPHEQLAHLRLVQALQLAALAQRLLLVRLDGGQAQLCSHCPVDVCVRARWQGAWGMGGGWGGVRKARGAGKRAGCVELDWEGAGWEGACVPPCPWRRRGCQRTGAAGCQGPWRPSSARPL